MAEEIKPKTENPDKSSQKVERDEKGRILPGQPSLNPAGRPKGTISLTAIIKQRLLELSPDQKRTALEWLADNIIQDALENNNKMRQLIWNYLDGMPKQTFGFDEPITGVKIEITENKNGDKSQSDKGVQEKLGGIPEKDKDSGESGREGKQQDIQSGPTVPSNITG